MTAHSSPVIQAGPADIELEQSLLGALMINNEALDQIEGFLRPEHFVEPVHQRIYEIICEKRKERSVANPMTIRAHFPADQRIGDLTTSQYLARVVTTAVTIVNTPDFARALHALASRRAIYALGANMMSAAEYNLSARETLAEAELQLVGLSAEAARSDPDANGPSQGYDAIISGAEQRMLTKKHYRGARTGLAALDERLGGLVAGDLILVGARPSMGKAQPLDARIRTPDGWVSMGSLRLDQDVSSIDGAPSSVTGVFPKGRREVFRVTFSDGRSTRCCAEHLWQIDYRSWASPRVVTTAKLMEMLQRKRYQKRLWIPMTDGAGGRDTLLPIDPYVLGALLGDGDLAATPRFSCATAEGLSTMAAKLPAEVEMISAGGTVDYRIRKVAGARRGRTNPITKHLRAMGLAGKLSREKFIPRAYLDASRGQRLDLLRGLLDTDGWVEKFGCVRFSSASPQLAADVQELARSLGSWCAMTTKATSFSHKGEKKQGLTAYVLTISNEDPASLFLLSTKMLRARPVRVRRKLPTVESIVPDGVEEVQCITVSHPSHLYITDNYVVTHNSAFSLSMARRAATLGIGVGFDSIEMNEESLRFRLVSDQLHAMGIGIPYKRLAEGRITPEEVSKSREAARYLNKLPLSIIDAGNRLADIPGHIRRARKECEAKGYPLGIFIVDYLGLISPGDRYAGNRVGEVTEISNTLKALAKREKLPIVALHQLSRANLARDDKRPQLGDLRDSGALEQDADVVMFIHREAYYIARRGYGKMSDSERAELLDKQQHVMEVIIDKQRNGPTGTVHLFTDMALNAVRDPARVDYQGL